MIIRFGNDWLDWLEHLHLEWSWRQDDRWRALVWSSARPTRNKLLAKEDSHDAVTLPRFLGCVPPSDGGGGEFVTVRNMRPSESTTKIWMKIVPYYQWKKVYPNDSFWRHKVSADIRGGSRRGRQTTQGCRQRQFSAFSLAISSETLDMRPALLNTDMQSVVVFSVIWKWPWMAILR